LWEGAAPGRTGSSAGRPAALDPVRERVAAVNTSARPTSIPEEAGVRLDDETLISKCRAGDQDAFRELVERYQRKVYGIAFGMLHNADDAMDITQEVFIRVHGCLGHFKGSSSFYTWLYRVGVNLCIDHLRKQAKNPTVDYDDALDHDYGEGAEDLLPATWAMNPGKAMDRKELSQMIQSALETLSPNHRAVLLMREVDGLSYSDMAEVMQCNKGTIMSRLFHARRRMQDALMAMMGEKNPLAE
jgi:RNA polymerase sigma-70 factor (ECF subfamily)